MSGGGRPVFLNPSRSGVGILADATSRSPLQSRRKETPQPPRLWASLAEQMDDFAGLRPGGGEAAGEAGVAAIALPLTSSTTPGNLSNI